MKKLKKNMFTSSIILIVSGLVTRILGFVYRIYMSNIIGSMGMGLYQLVIPIYTLVWSITCSGFNTTISKLTSSEKAKGNYGNIRRFLMQAICVTTLLSVGIAVVMFVFAEFIAGQLFNEPRIALSIQVLAFAVPFMAVGSSIRGYFYGLHDAMIPAISQVIEQVVRLFVVYLVATMFMGRGIEFTIAAMMTGVVAGEAIASVYVFCSYKDYNPKQPKVAWASDRFRGDRPQAKPDRQTLRKIRKSFAQGRQVRRASLMTLIAMSVPLSLSRVSGSLLSTVENILIPQRLVLYGMTQSEALSEFGKLTGMAMPLIQLPSVVLVALSISLVPAISESLAVGNYNKINRTVSQTMLFSMVVGMGGTAVFIGFADVLGQLIYSQDIARMLVYLGLLSPFLYVNSLMTGILNGLGLQMFIFRNSLISSVIALGFIWFAIPIMGIYGFILGWLCSLLVLCGINVYKIRQTAGIRLDLFNWFGKPVVCALASVVMINWLRDAVYARMGAMPGTVVLVGVMGLVYVALVVVTGCVKLGELKQLRG